jgi:lipid II:glycine glycyltransferase (peptidoglycan interpeptide bridge formation enzyme)
VDDSTVGLGEFCDIVSSWYYGGPLLSSKTSETENLTKAFATAFHEYCTEAGIVAEFIRFDPNLRNHDTFACLEPTFERETVPLKLDVSIDALWEGFERRNRNAIRQGRDSGIVVETTHNSKAIKAFFDIYTDAMEALNASSHYRFPLSFFYKLLDDRNLTTFLLATYEDTVIGGHVVVHDDTVAHDYLRASDPDYWDMRVNNLLCYTSLLQMRDRGLEIFDFQGGRPGVFRFKKGFSPDRREFHVGKRIHLPEVYDQLIEEAERAGIDTSGEYFPNYRIPQSN